MNTMHDGFGKPPKAVPIIPLECYAGIDPGKKGYVAVISAAGDSVLWADPIPVIKTGKSSFEYDLRAISKLADRLKGVRVYLEQQQAMPQQGGVSNFTIGRGYGLIEMALICAGASVVRVRPSVWKKLMGLTIPRKQSKEMSKTEKTNILKNKSLVAAQDRFPGHEFRPSPRHKASSDMAEAILLAVYGRMIHVGAV